MKIIVCVKQIPDPGILTEPAIGTSWLVPNKEPLLDDTDRYGIEIGLQLANEDASVTLLSMGAGESDDGIRQGLAMGADKAILVRDDPEHGSDALTTARALSSVIAKEGFDLVITGVASTDGSSGVVCQMLGELLGVPSVSDVTNVDSADDLLTVHRQTPGGYDVVSCKLPAAISVTAGSVEPRYPTFKGHISSKRKQVARQSLAELVDDLPGALEAMPKITAVAPGTVRVAGKKIEDDGEAHQAIIAVLKEQRVI